jgi:tetratricopeptide (TPR) repeat protein
MKKMGVGLGILFGSVLMLLVMSCQAAGPTKKEEASWSGKMQQLSRAFSSVLPYVYSPKNYSDPKNRESIDKGLGEMATLAHQVDMQEVKSRPDYDPSLEYLSKELSEDIRGAHAAFKSGNVEYSRLVMASAVSRCFYCHTRTDFGPQLKVANSNIEKLGLPPAEKADLLVALRDYDGALKVLETALADPKFVSRNFFETEKVIKKLMFIAVRVKHDPVLAQKAVDQLLAHPSLPHFIKKDATIWKKSLQQWVLDESRLKKGGKIDALKEAKKLLKTAEKIQEYPMDSAPEVEYLRASGYLHDALKEKQKPEQMAETLLLLGRCYESLRDVGFWNLHEVYFAQCVREAPRAKSAKDCYRRYESSVILGYSGSAGIFLPENVLAELQSLHDLINKK